MKNNRRAHRTASSPDGAWFAPKRFGYGSGLPVAWQGWLVYGLYFALVFALGYWGGVDGKTAHLGALTLIALATGLLIVACAKKTRGGWKWRGGKSD